MADDRYKMKLNTVESENCSLMKSSDQVNVKLKISETKEASSLLHSTTTSRKVQSLVPRKLGHILEPDNNYPRAPNFEIGLSKYEKVVYLCLSKYKNDHVYQLNVLNGTYYCKNCRNMTSVVNNIYHIETNKIVPDPDTIEHQCLTKASTLGSYIVDQCLK